MGAPDIGLALGSSSRGRLAAHWVGHFRIFARLNSERLQILLLLKIGGDVAVATAHAPVERAEDVARRLYEWRLASETSGAPDAAELAEMRPLVSAQLACLLEAASRYRDVHAGVSPRSCGMQPPLTRRLRRRAAEADLALRHLPEATMFKGGSPVDACSVATGKDYDRLCAP